ncbi:hypothetical protein [Microbacterium dauci]|uniref:hypothetical protein n=1 Tax=Microbacterium dauci TaxID=3048008 RepID=UPI0024BC3A6E|nr:hypothetical protein [Microbacterium sp. LX3-4]
MASTDRIGPVDRRMPRGQHFGMTNVAPLPEIPGAWAVPADVAAPAIRSALVPLTRAQSEAFDLHVGALRVARVTDWQSSAAEVFRATVGEWVAEIARVALDLDIAAGELRAEAERLERGF